MESRPVAVVTGASSGIGYALSLELARRGHDVALLARRVDRLDRLAEEIEATGAAALPLACDVSVDGSIDDAVARVVERFGRLDVAVANAGISVVGPLAKLELDDYRRVFETNVFGVLRTAYAVRKPLEASRGAFGIVGSVSGYLAMPTTSAYAASKYAARAIAEALHHEWRAAGVCVTHIAPGFVESEIRVLDNEGKNDGQRKDPIPTWLVMPSKKAARQIADALAARQRELVLTGHGKAAALVARHTPGLLALGLYAAGSRVRAPRMMGQD